ncbi:hypothetical protein BaRGS_00008865 [Batillaria attramentaria]|uniref:Uncharacterized protein n=1 Tax=Batillaria attramentaria TaxID=370345 RepID=A0ABD0LL15_9CAEN
MKQGERAQTNRLIQPLLFVHLPSNKPRGSVNRSTGKQTATYSDNRDGRPLIERLAVFMCHAEQKSISIPPRHA